VLSTATKMTGKRLFEGRTEQEKFATMVRRFSEASRFRESLAATGEEAAASERNIEHQRARFPARMHEKVSGF